MLFDLNSVYAVVVLVVVTGLVTRLTLGIRQGRGKGGDSISARLVRMEERIAKMEEATTGLVAEFAAVRERERFMTQIIETRARKVAADLDRQSSAPAPAAAKTDNDSASPFVVQTVSAARREFKPGR